MTSDLQVNSCFIQARNTLVLGRSRSRSVEGFGDPPLSWTRTCRSLDLIKEPLHEQNLDVLEQRLLPFTLRMATTFPDTRVEVQKRYQT